MVYLLHFIGMKLMDAKKHFGIKDATTKHIPCTGISADPDTDHLTFTKAHWISMDLLVQECSCRTFEIMCPGNYQALINYVTGLFLELPMLR